SLALLIAGVLQLVGIEWLKIVYFPFTALLATWYGWRTVLILALLTPFLELNIFLQRGVEARDAAFFLSLVMTSVTAAMLSGKAGNRTVRDASGVFDGTAPGTGETGQEPESDETVVTRYFQSMFKPDEEIREVLKVARNTLYADSVHLFLNAEGTLRLRCSTEETGGIIPSKEGILTDCFQEKRPALLSDVLEKKREVGYLKKDKISSLLAVPMLDGTFCFGVVAADSGRFQAFSSADQEILQTCANQVMRILQRERVYRQIQRSFDHLNVLNEESSKLLSSLNIEVIARHLTEGVHKIAACTAVFCLSKGRELVIVGQFGLPAQEKRCFSVKGSILDMAVRNGDAVYISDARDYRTPVLPFKTDAVGSVFALPTLYEKEILGVLILVSEKTNAFNSSQIEFIELLANQASSSLANAKFHEEIERLAVTDGLTGLFNHRHFQEKLSDEFNRLGRFTDPLSLLLIDIDHFKKVNDTYGHPVGDAVLKKVAAIIGKTIRNIDIAARYGGEEFALILPGTGSPGAMNMAERLRKTIMDTNVKAEQESFSVTVSIGISTSAQGGTEAKNKEELIERADKALYEAKRTGRNRSVIWEMKERTV
ncbi:MAG: diguanylate cyclase, partial [Nitrospirota bacterium]